MMTLHALLTRIEEEIAAREPADAYGLHVVCDTGHKGGVFVPFNARIVDGQLRINLIEQQRMERQRL